MTGRAPKSISAIFILYSYHARVSDDNPTEAISPATSHTSSGLRAFIASAASSTPITRAVVEAVSIPVTVKTRLGWDCEHKIITTLGPQLQDCGIKALTVHGRTRSQMYTGSADWTLIGRLKEDEGFTIPLIGNGDITTPEQTLDAFSRYGVDGIMVGRAAIGAPWIFRDIRSYLDTGSYTPLGPAEKMAMLRRIITESVERIDEYRGILHIRRHLAASPLFKGIPDFRQTRIRMLRADTVAELMLILDEIADKFLKI